jgi:hypothetical protein
MSAYTFSGMEINVPECNTMDSLAEQRERRDARTRARMDKNAYKDAILASLADAIGDERNPIGELVDMLFEAPIRDHFDARAFVEIRDGHSAGRTLLHRIVEASLEAYESADSEGF